MSKSADCSGARIIDDNFIVEVPRLVNGAKDKKTIASAADAVHQARQTYEIGRTNALVYRRRQLKQLALMYAEQEAAMLEALQLDLGKPKMETLLFEIEFIRNDLRYVRANFESWIQPVNAYKRMMDFFANPQIYHDSYGVVLIVGAWNYPLQSTLLPLASAIAAGNCVVLQPPAETTHTSRFLMETLPAYLDRMSYFVLEPTDRTHCHLRFDYVFFTGALETAKVLHANAAKSLTPGTYVVGGKNPVYVDESADVKISTRRILWGKCVNAGQTCIGPGYVLCTKAVMKRMLQAVPRIMEEFYGGNAQKSPDYGRIISVEHFDRLIETLKGKNIAYGGGADKKKLFMQLTIVTEVTPNDALLHDETNGPILPFVTVANMLEAIAFIRAREKPLALYVFAKDNKVVEGMLTQTTSGGATVNDVLMHIAAESLPFGGVGMSGMGAYHGKRTFDAFTHEKSVLKKRLNFLIDQVERVRYPPYTPTKLALVVQLMRKRRSFNVSWLLYVFVFLLGVALGWLLM